MYSWCYSQDIMEQINKTKLFIVSLNLNLQISCATKANLKVGRTLRLFVKGNNMTRD